MSSIGSGTLVPHTEIGGTKVPLPHNSKMGEWKECKLGECIEVINGYAFKSQNFLEEQIENSLPVVKIKNVANGDVNLKAVQYHVFDKSLEKYLIQKNDVLIALTGNHPQAITQVVGEASKYKLDELAFLNQRVAKIKARENMSNNFLYYFVKDDASHDYLASQSSGSANQANISKSDIENMPISLPPLEEQKAITEVLSSLDDKIDLLHRQNKTLEELAQTLFRQWFIEEAKDEWEVGTLSYFANNPRKSIKPAEIELDAKYIGLEHIERKNISLVQSGDSSAVASNKYQFEENDILFGKLRPYFHKVCFTSHDGICSTDILVIRPKKTSYFAYTLLAFNQEDVINYANAGSEGTRMPRTNWDVLSQYPVQIPSEHILEEFNLMIIPSIKKIKNNQTQIKILENMRDTLLPKLMSGEIRIKD